MSEASRKFCTFFLGDRLYGVPVDDVQEINTETTITPIHHADKEVLGYVNLRGRIHLIVDPMVLLDLPRDTAPEKQHLLLFKDSVSEAFGMRVDQVGDIVEIRDRDIQDRRQTGVPSSSKPEERRSSKDISAGVCLMEDQLMIVINTSALIS